MTSSIDPCDRSGPVLVVRRRFPGHGFAAARKLSHQPSVRTLAGAVTGDGTLVAAWQVVPSGDRTELSLTLPARQAALLP